MPTRRPKVTYTEIENDLEMVHSVAVADLDGDGKQEVIGSNIYIGGETRETVYAVRWYRPPFWNAVDIYSGPLEGARILPMDIDRDGRMDLVRASRYGNTVSWFENPGGDYHRPWKEHVIDSFPIPHDLMLADIDHDGELELVAGAVNDEGGCLFWYDVPADPTGDWLRNVIDGKINRSHHGGGWGGHGMDIANMGANGALCVLTCSMGEGQYLCYEQGREPGLWQRRIIGGGPLWGTASSVRAIDIDGDGRHEVFAGGEHSMGSGAWYTPENMKLMLYRPMPDGTWVEQVIDEPGEVHDIKAYDIDGDGQPEIFVANRLQNRVLMYDAEDDSGTRWTRHVIDDEMQASEIQIADVDGDGTAELVVGGLRSANVRIYKVSAN